MKPLLASLALSVLLPAILPGQEPSQGDADRERAPGQRLVGQYEIVEGAKDGMPSDPKRLKDNTVAITRDTIAVVDRDKKELYSAAYKLTRGGERGLWQIDLESKVPKAGAKAVGLLKRNGDQLWLIYGLDGKRPENFDKTTKGQHLFKMKRKAETPDLNEPAEKAE